MPDRGLVLGGGAARMRTVRLGGPLKRPVRRNAADAREGEDVICTGVLLLLSCQILGVGSRLLWMFWMV